MKMRTIRFRRLAAMCVVAALVVGLSAQMGADAAVRRQTNTASDVGITPTQITLGNVVTLTGPIPGLFKGSQAGTDAYFKYINSLGGVNKRKLVMKSADDALNCNQNQTQTEDLVGSVFAFVGSFAVFDNCGAKVFAQNPNVADVHYLLSDDANKEVNGFSPQPAPPGFRTGPYQYYKQKYPDAVKKVGSLFASTSPTTWANQKAAEESLGYKILYERAVAPTETDWTTDIIRMKNLGVQFWDLRNQNASFIAKMLSEAAQQNFHPQVVITNTEYDESFFKLIPDPTAANGVLTDQPFAMFLGEDAKKVPEVKLFQTWMKKTHSDVTPDLFAMYSWASAALFVDALKAAGQNPTRAGLIAALKNIHSFDDNGMVAPADVGNKKPPACWMLLKVDNGKFVRALPKSKGYTCKPTGYYYAKS
jgi:ABC-type branched-subunit amino acid transport system substrate-binding protein